jgi:hypothetical protein
MKPPGGHTALVERLDYRPHVLWHHEPLDPLFAVGLHKLYVSGSSKENRPSPAHSTNGPRESTVGRVVAFGALDVRWQQKDPQRLPGFAHLYATPYPLYRATSLYHLCYLSLYQKYPWWLLHTAP